MANIAVIIAGGSGHRMGQDIPKQFINVYDKPVLIYTLESFQKHPQIDAIEVVCIDGWHDIVWAYAKQFNIDKLKWVVSGGSTGQFEMGFIIWKERQNLMIQWLFMMEFGH
mgnify:CR=1 FL=1